MRTTEKIKEKNRLICLFGIQVLNKSNIDEITDIELLGTVLFRLKELKTALSELEQNGTVE